MASIQENLYTVKTGWIERPMQGSKFKPKVYIGELSNPKNWSDTVFMAQSSRKGNTWIEEKGKPAHRPKGNLDMSDQEETKNKPADISQDKKTTEPVNSYQTEEAGHPAHQSKPRVLKERRKRYSSEHHNDADGNVVQAYEIAERCITESTTTLSPNKPHIYAVYNDPRFTFCPEVSLANGINTSDLQVISSELFDQQPEIYSHTLKNIANISWDRVLELKTWRHQFGQRAYILLHEAQIHGRKTPVYFVTCLAREKDGLPYKQLKYDFEALQQLADRFDKKLPAQYRNQFSVLKPIGLGRVRYQNGDYPFYTTPFVPLGELKVNFVEILYRNGANLPVPHFDYSIPYNDRMIKTSAQENLMTETRRMDFYKALKERNTSRYPAHLYETKRYYRQLETLLKAELFVYHLTGGYFPRDHQINAGDWMAEITDDGLGQMKLITIRGGLEGPYTEEGFYRRLQYQTEISRIIRQNPPELHKPDEEVTAKIKLFEDLPRSVFNDLMKETKDVIIPG